MEDPNIILVGVIFALLVVVVYRYRHRIKARFKFLGVEVDLEAENADPAPAQSPPAEAPVSSQRQATIEGPVTVHRDYNVTFGKPSKKARPP